MYEQDPQQPLATSAMAITGFVIGLVALLTSFLPFINNFSFILGLLALIFSIVGLVGCARGKKKGKGLAIAALIISILSCVVVLWSQSVYSAAIDDAFSTTKAATTTTKAATSTTKTSSDSKTNSGTTTGESTSSESKSSTAASAEIVATNDNTSNEEASTSESTSSGATAENVEASIDVEDLSQYAYQITVVGCDLDESYDGKLCAVITYTFTNNSDEATSFSGSIHDRAYQNGVELSSAIVSGGWDTIDNAIKDVKPGATITVSGAFILDDESDITVECTEWGAFDDVILAEATFPVV